MPRPKTLHKPDLKCVGQIRTPMGLFKQTKGGTEIPHTDGYTPIWNAVEQAIENGFDGRESAVTILPNEAMRIEQAPY